MQVFNFPPLVIFLGHLILCQITMHSTLSIFNAPNNLISFLDYKIKQTTHEPHASPNGNSNEHSKLYCDTHPTPSFATKPTQISADCSLHSLPSIARKLNLLNICSSLMLPLTHLMKTFVSSPNFTTSLINLLRHSQATIL